MFAHSHSPGVEFCGWVLQIISPHWPQGVQVFPPGAFGDGASGAATASKVGVAGDAGARANAGADQGAQLFPSLLLIFFVGNNASGVAPKVGVVGTVGKVGDAGAWTGVEVDQGAQFFPELLGADAGAAETTKSEETVDSRTLLGFKMESRPPKMAPGCKRSNRVNSTIMFTPEERESYGFKIISRRYLSKD